MTNEKPECMATELSPENEKMNRLKIRFNWEIYENEIQNYHLRAECINDIKELFKYFESEFIEFSMEPDKDLPDVEFKFKTKLNIHVFRTLIKELIRDGHVMYESLDYEKSYTGERKYTPEPYKTFNLIPEEDIF